MDRMRQFRAARFADRRGVDLVQDDDCFEFYCAAARRSVTDGGPGRLVALEVAGEPVAVAFDLTDDNSGALPARRLRRGTVAELLTGVC